MTGGGTCTISGGMVLGGQGQGGNGGAALFNN